MKVIFCLLWEPASSPERFFNTRYFVARILRIPDRKKIYMIKARSHFAWQSSLESRAIRIPTKLQIRYAAASSLHEELSGWDLLFRGPNELFYFFFTSIYRHFVNNFTLFTKLLHSFQINTDFIIIIITWIMTWTLFLRIEWRFPA